MSKRPHDQKTSPEPAGKARANTPLVNFEKLERERQTEWLFLRHRRTRPAWKRD